MQVLPKLPLGPHLLFAVDTGIGGATDPTCAAYDGNSTYIFGGAGGAALSTFPTTYTATGWENTAAGDKWYRFSWLLPANASNAIQGYGVTATFTWEAQNV